MALPVCLACIGQRQAVASEWGESVVTKPLIDKAIQSKLLKSGLPKFRNLADLGNYTWLGMPAGRDVISSLVTATGCIEPDTKTQEKLIYNYLRDYMGVYLTLQAYCRNEKFDKVYIFNGRFAPAKALLRICQRMNISYITQERLGMPDRVVTITNGIPHQVSQYGPLINKFWEKNHSNKEIYEEAVEFFEERPRGRITGSNSFVTGQDPGRLPKSWNTAKRNIAVFASSEGEFTGLPEVFEGTWATDQRLAYISLARRTAEKSKQVMFYLRIHPNSIHERQRWWESSEFAHLENMEVIPPDSNISTYELLSACDTTIVFMSTIGVEATYWGKPAIALTCTSYSGIGACYEAKDIEEAVSLVVTGDLSPKPRDAALAYGAFMRRGFEKLPFSEALDHCTLTFKGRRYNAHDDIIRSLWNWENIVSKAPLPEWVKRLWQKWEWYRLSKFLGPPRAPKIH